MTAYVIFNRLSTSDRDRLDIYNATAPASAEGHQLTPLVFYGQQEVLEGPPIEGTVLLRFPTMADAKAWYDSPAYQAAAVHRKAGSQYSVLIVEGLAEPSGLTER